MGSLHILSLSLCCLGAEDSEAVGMASPQIEGAQVPDSPCGRQSYADQEHHTGLILHLLLFLRPLKCLIFPNMKH